jgi:hypothetical protein
MITSSQSLKALERGKREYGKKNLSGSDLVLYLYDFFPAYFDINTFNLERGGLRRDRFENKHRTILALYHNLALFLCFIFNSEDKFWRACE